MHIWPSIIFCCRHAHNLTKREIPRLVALRESRGKTKLKYIFSRAQIAFDTSYSSIAILNNCIALSSISSSWNASRSRSNNNALCFGFTLSTQFKFKYAASSTSSQSAVTSKTIVQFRKQRSKVCSFSPAAQTHRDCSATWSISLILMFRFYVVLVVGIRTRCVFVARNIIPRGHCSKRYAVMAVHNEVARLGLV